MAYWLLKTEPGEYSYADLEREGQDGWDGVRNAQAQKHLRAMRAGDQAFIYHTGNEKAVVGIADVVRAAYPDPSDPEGRAVQVGVAARARLARPVLLSEIKADGRFAGWELVRHPRLSVMPVPPEHWQAVTEMAGGTTA